MALTIRPVRGEISQSTMQTGKSALRIAEATGPKNTVSNIINDAGRQLIQFNRERDAILYKNKMIEWQGELSNFELKKAREITESEKEYTPEQWTEIEERLKPELEKELKRFFKDDPTGANFGKAYLPVYKASILKELNSIRNTRIGNQTIISIDKQQEQLKKDFHKHFSNSGLKHDKLFRVPLISALEQLNPLIKSAVRSERYTVEDELAQIQRTKDNFWTAYVTKEVNGEIDYEASLQRLKEKLPDGEYIPREQKKRLEQELIKGEEKQQEKDKVYNNNKIKNLNLEKISDEEFQKLQFKGANRFELKEGLAKTREKIIDKTIANKANVIASNYFTIEIEQGRYLDLDIPVHIPGLDDKGESYSFKERLGGKTFDLVDKNMTTMTTLMKLRDETVDERIKEYNTKFNEFKEKFKLSVQGDNQAFAILRSNEIFTTLRNKTKKLYDEGISLEEIFDDLESKNNIEKNIEAYFPTRTHLQELRFKEQTRDVNMKDFLQEKNNIKKLLEEAKEAQNKKQIKKIQKQFDEIKKKEKRLWFMPPPFDENTMTDQEYLNSKLYKSWEAQNSKVQAFRRYNNIRKNN